MDRNFGKGQLLCNQVLSLSARRAWIEIRRCFAAACRLPVALRKESVDRNRVVKRLDGLEGRSLSARRAWIEIPPAR